MAELLVRHAMVNPSPPAWAALMGRRSDLGAVPLLSRWAQDGHPLVVRRAAAGDEAGAVPLGLPLPPAHGKRRIAVTFAREDIHRIGPPPLLAEAAAAAPSTWHDTIDRLLHLDPLTRTFGGLAWQHLTGLTYLSEGSDLDLLWGLPPQAHVGALLDGIAAIAATAPMRVDGEIVGAAGGVQWRELQGDAAVDVVVKGPGAVRLMSRAVFLDGRA